MYYGNQIIWDLDEKKLAQLDNPDSVWAWDASQFPKRHCHLVYTDKAQANKAGDIYVSEGGLNGAEYFLEKGEIKPSKV